MYGSRRQLRRSIRVPPCNSGSSTSHNERGRRRYRRVGRHPNTRSAAGSWGSDRHRSRSYIRPAAQLQQGGKATDCRLHRLRNPRKRIGKSARIARARVIARNVNGRRRKIREEGVTALHQRRNPRHPGTAEGIEDCVAGPREGADERHDRVRRDLGVIAVRAIRGRRFVNGNAFRRTIRPEPPFRRFGWQR